MFSESRSHGAAVVRLLYDEQLLVAECLVNDGVELVHHSDDITGCHVSRETIKANNINVGGFLGC